MPTPILSLPRLALCALLALAGLAPVAASAATRTVTTTADSGAGSLRQAITTAAAGDTIAFSLPNPSTIKLTSGQIALTKAVKIAGPGTDRLTISGSNKSRVFRLSSSVTASISKLTLADGLAPGSPGGAIYLDVATLTLDAVRFAWNKAGSGAAIGLTVSTLYVHDCTFDDNTATASGGAIYAQDSAVLIRGSAFYQNTAITGGGAVQVRSSTFTLTNSTLSKNTAASGGAFLNEMGSIYSYNSTIADNTATRQGGGILDLLGATTYLYNTILALNHAPAFPDFAGDFGSQQDAAGGTIVGIGTGTKIDLFGTNYIGSTAKPLDPLLGPIADNGGLTWTMALLPGSPAVNFGVDASAIDPETQAPLTTEQRGFARIALGRVDSGAYEAYMPYYYKLQALAFVPTSPVGNATVDAAFAAARGSIGTSLDWQYWTDGFRLNATGPAVFTAESQAAMQLLKIVNLDGLGAVAAQHALDALAEADRKLVQIAIADATAKPAPIQAKLNAAATSYTQAEAFRLQRKYVEAIATYGAAWKSAWQAGGGI